MLKVKQIRSFRLSGGTTVSQTSELAADEDNEEDNNDSELYGDERGYHSTQLWEWKKQHGENHRKWRLNLNKN